MVRLEAGSVDHHAPASMLSPRVLRTLSEAAYAFLVIITIVASGLSCAAILSQAVRTSPTESWDRNFNALIVGASYVVLVRSSRRLYARTYADRLFCGMVVAVVVCGVQLAVSLSFCVKRRVAVRSKLQRISRTYRTIGRDNLPGVSSRLAHPNYAAHPL